MSGKELFDAAFPGPPRDARKPFETAHLRAVGSHANVMSPRDGQRFGLALALTVEGMEGETHDISESGILFETDAEPKVGARIGLTLRYSMHGQEWQHRCQAQVVRVERVGAKVNVAAQLLSPLHESNLSS